MHTDRQLKTILVFRTSVTTLMDVRRLKSSLDHLIYPGDRWNFDLEDGDHILRVESLSVTASAIISIVEEVGYMCSELEDNIEVGLLDGNPAVTSYPEMKTSAGL